MGCVVRSPVDENLEPLDPIGDLLRLLKECGLGVFEPLP